MGIAAHLRYRTSIVMLAGLLLALGAALVLNQRGGESRSAVADRERPAVDEPTTTRPEATRGTLVGTVFPAVMFIGLDGRALASRDAAGRAVIVVLWDSGCDCSRMYEAANGVLATHGDKAAVIGISMDSDLARAAQTAFESGQLFSSGLDRGHAITDALGGVTRPQILVLSPDGVIVAQADANATTDELLALLP